MAEAGTNTRGNNAPAPATLVIARTLRIGWCVVLAALRYAVRQVIRRAWHAHESSASILGRTLQEFFVALGPAHIKLGQLLSTRTDLFPTDALLHLRQLQDDLPPEPRHRLESLFASELGVEINDVFAELDTTPIASASIATVYRGKLKGGGAVAIKVKRSDVTHNIQTDVQLLRKAGRVLNRLPGMRSLPIAITVDDFCTCLERQCDFRREAAANRRLRRALRFESGIVIPQLINSMCSDSILTMEFYAGTPPGRDAAHAYAALQSTVRALYRMIFVDGCIHCDLHRGNLFFLEGGRVVLLDFGFVVEIDDGVRLKFAQFFYAMATNNGSRCARIAHEMALAVAPTFSYDAFAADVRSLVAHYSGVRAREFSVARFVGALFELHRRHGLSGSSVFVMPIVSLLVLEGIVNEVTPDLDFQREAQPYLMRALLRPQQQSEAFRLVHV